MKHSEKSTKYEHFNAVYAGSYAEVLRWIRGRVPADLAEELTQQTFMQYWQWLLAAAAFPKSDKSLLLSIARSVCADHYRAIAARAVCVAIPEDFDLPDRADPITMVEWAQVLGMLGREDQILLAMRRQGYGSKEIGLALGISGSAYPVAKGAQAAAQGAGGLTVAPAAGLWYNDNRICEVVS